ncbi:MAG: divalent metal cation transporter [Proteobacteria bacterium]|nr:divalent metal cation transporter [Pseudomonadota bacterium]
MPPTEPGRDAAPAASDATDADPSRPPAWWALLGPGLVTGAADDDPSGIATYTQAGAQFGYASAWTLLLTYPLMVGIQLASARIGRVTGHGLTETFARFCPRWLVFVLVGLLVVANVINLGADLNAMGDAAALVAGGSRLVDAALLGLVSLALQVVLPYRRYAAVLKWLTLSLLAYVALAFAVHVDWPAALRSTVMPTWHWDRDYVTTIVAIFGTTISPYLFFWQAAQEVEEIGRVRRDRPLRAAPAQAPAQMRRITIDTVIGMAFSNLVAWFMIVATAATLHAQGVTKVESTTQAAAALKPLAGEFAFALFGLGIVGTGLLALPVLAGSAAYAVASLFRWRKGLEQAPRQAPRYYGVIAAAIAIGIAMSAAGLDPIGTLYWAAVINAVIAVPVMVAVMLAATRRVVMGRYTLGTGWRWAGWAATAAMAAATLAMFATMLV